LITAEVLREFCRHQGLAGFKLPRVVAAHAGTLPTNESGKVLKNIIKTNLEALLKGANVHSRL